MNNKDAELYNLLNVRFKPGTKVICVKSKLDWWLRVGKIYTVENSINGWGDGIKVDIKVEGKDIYYMHTRFENLAEYRKKHILNILNK